MKKLPLFLLFLVAFAACGDACEGGSSSVPPVDTPASSSASPGPSGRMRPRIHLNAPPTEQEGGAPAPSAVP
jgi:hypothetical protein